jgi:hypothetical protein
MIARLGGYVPTFDDESGEPHWRCLRCRVTGPCVPKDESRQLVLGNEVVAILCLDCALDARSLLLQTLPELPRCWGGLERPRATRQAVRYWLGQAKTTEQLVEATVECLRAGALIRDVTELVNRRLFGSGPPRLLEARP